MREITKEMIKSYKIKEFDFMGYDIKKKQGLSFHHLIVPHRESRHYGIGEGYVWWNGAILVQHTSHDYLHLIENKEEEIFNRITSEMIDENVKVKLDIDNLKRIKNLLIYFEKEYQNKRSKKGKILIKSSYILERHKF